MGDMEAREAVHRTEESPYKTKQFHSIENVRDVVLEKAR